MNRPEPHFVIELRLVGGWVAELEQGLRMQLERYKPPVKLPPIPDDDPE